MDEKIGDVVKKNEEEISVAFKGKMLKVMRENRELKYKSEAEDREMKLAEQRKGDLQRERDWLKNEATKLDKIRLEHK
jgi:hypothetical protein